MPRWSREEQNAIRADVFRWLGEQLQGGKLDFTRAELAGYEFDGVRIPLIDPNKGIRNPADFEATLSISTSASRRNPYADEESEGGIVRYDYRTGDGGDNIKLRKAAELGVPLIYFKQVYEAGPLVPVFPVYIVKDDPAERAVYIAMDEVIRFFADPLHLDEDERRYVERRVHARLHQPVFRARVITAYASKCAICSLRHVELLDAAHITPDSAERSSTNVTNGISLCKIHHAAYDQNFLGITPDYEVRIDHNLLNEVDGPMLRHGLQDMHGRRLSLPTRRTEWPNRERLAERFAEFAA